MFVSEVATMNFRSCREVRVRLRPEVTVLAGENNAGKTTVIDALRQLTDALDGRRGAMLAETDVHDGRGPDDQVQLHAVLADIDPNQAGTYRDAFLPGATADAAHRSFSQAPLAARRHVDAAFGDAVARSLIPV